MEKLQTGVNKNQGRVCVTFARSRSYISLESDSEQLHECEPDSIKSARITMNEQSHKEPRAEDDHCILYMMESETKNTLVAVNALHQNAELSSSKDNGVRGKKL